MLVVLFTAGLYLYFGKVGGIVNWTKSELAELDRKTRHGYVYGYDYLYPYSVTRETNQT